MEALRPQQQQLPIRRRPVAAPSAGAAPSLAPSADPPLPLRPSRSATDLKAKHDAPETGIIDVDGQRRVDFVVDDLPTKPALTPGLSETEVPEFRRVQSASSVPTPLVEDETPKDPSKWKTALGEAQYFAGGLISRPAEVSKHYSVIRHSSALIWYRGPSTSVSITILADQPLPPNRTIWLQRKGFTGNMGMSLKALVRTTGSWIDVTPISRAGPEHISEKDERSMQRDLRRFAKKATGKATSHMPRQTCVIRIPAAATDGYFRLVMCAGDDPEKEKKKVLCGSPVFRIASTSTDSSIVRGASLRTMPVELSVKVASAIGRQVANSYAGGVGTAVQSQISKVVPLGALQTAGSVAQFGYDNSKFGTSINDSVAAGREVSYDSMMGDVLDTPVSIIGSDAGPSAPFPLKFEGKVVQGTGQSTAELGFPTANLSGVPDTVKIRLDGVFAAWATILPSKELDGISADWHEAIVTVAPRRNSLPTVVQKNAVCVHLIHDFAGATFLGAKVQVLLMGYLHPSMSDADTAPEDLIEELHMDTATTLASLARDTWGPHETLTRMSTLRSERSFSQKLSEATGKVQHQVDRVPLHWAGVRSESGTLRDQTFGRGGLWIPRDVRPEAQA